MESTIRRVVVDLVTSYAAGAGTRADVFLGLGGREFRLKVPKSADFERGGELSYQLGEDSNVEAPERNDPRLGMPVTVGAVLEHPVYIRITARNDKDDWNLESVKVRIVHDIDRRSIRYSALDGTRDNIWLGLQSGTMLYLKRSPEDRSGLGDV